VVEHRDAEQPARGDDALGEVEVVGAGLDAARRMVVRHDDAGRASDAHAWVEVWFPETGWQAFDPTADVPLAGETTRSSVGGDIVRSVSDTVGRLLRDHGRTVAAGALAALGRQAIEAHLAV
jgi:transglutaminase-like putative cysteine protease